MTHDRGTLVSVAAAALLMAGCQYAQEPAPEENTSRLMQACEETDRLLGQMKSAEPSFSYDDAGNARIAPNLWAAIPAAMQDALMNAIAYRAVCASGEAREQVVTVRNSETSEVLAEKTVTEFVR